MIGYKLYTKQTGAKGILCEKVLVCGAVDIKKEFYFAILLDRGVGGPVMIARYELVARIISSPNGGMDIEEVSKTKPVLTSMGSLKMLSGLVLETSSISTPP